MEYVAPAGCATSTAEMTMALLLKVILARSFLLRRIPAQMADVAIPFKRGFDTAAI